MTDANPVFDAIAEHVFELGDRAGHGSQMKLINQLLAGVHIAAAAEAMNLAASLDMDLHKVIDVISQCAGSSWMFENRAPHIADGDYHLSRASTFCQGLRHCDGGGLPQAGRYTAVGRGACFVSRSL